MPNSSLQVLKSLGSHTRVFTVCHFDGLDVSYFKAKFRNGEKVKAKKGIAN